MKRFLYLFGFLLFGYSAYSQEFRDINDSRKYVEVHPEYGKFLYHEVKPKETLYSLSKQYGCSLENLYSLNQADETWIISPGNLIRIPFSLHLLSSTKENGKTALYYKVQPKDNIFRISKIYFGQDILTMQRRNKMTSLDLSIDQILHIGWQKDLVNYPLEENTTITLTKVDTLKTPEREEFIKKNDLFNPMDTVENVEKSFKSRHGIAVWKESSDHHNLYAMHRTARVNSLIEIYNPLLNRRAFAKVISRIPKGLYSDDVDLIITPRVATALGMKDKRFRVEMTFYE